MKYPWIFQLALFLLAPFMLAGCGGSNPTATSQSGRAVFTITWPAPTRLVPSLSKSISITITDGKQFTVTKLVPRPTTSNTVAVTIEGLPVGDLTDTLVAYPNADGSGVAQATGSALVTVKADQVTAVTITLSSTINNIVLTPTSPTVSIHSTLQFAATAYNASGAVVLAPITFASGTPTVGSIDPKTGLLTALAAGNTTITATDPESGVKASTLLTVSAGDTATITISGSVDPGVPNGTTAYTVAPAAHYNQQYVFTAGPCTVSIHPTSGNVSSGDVYPFNLSGLPPSAGMFAFTNNWYDTNFPSDAINITSIHANTDGTSTIGFSLSVHKDFGGGEIIEISGSGTFTAPTVGG